MAATERPEPSLLLVAYGWSPAKEARLRAFCQDFVPRDRVLVLRNDQDPTQGSFRELRGSNRYAEFSGYLEGLAEMPQDGPLIVANDTLLTHRATSAWKHLLSHPELPNDRIFGDFRLQSLDEVQLPMLASWLFYLPIGMQRYAFEFVVQVVTDDWGNPPFGPRYQAVVEKYLRGGLLSGWIHAGRRDPEAIELKRNCIYAEHRLSLLLDELIYTPAAGEPLAVQLQKVNRRDRLIALWRRIVTKLRRP